MNAVTPMRNARSLTDQQRQFVDELVASGCTPTEAARSAGFAAPGQEAYRLMRKPHVMAAIREERDRVISGSLCNIAVKTLAEIMVDKTLPAAARVSACRVAVEMGGYFDKSARPDEDKALDEMSEAELMEVMARARETIDASAKPSIEVLEPV